MGHLLVSGSWNNGSHRNGTAPLRAGNEIAPSKIRHTVQPCHASLEAGWTHELGHVQGHHTRKRILVLACVVAVISSLSLGVTPASSPYRAMFMTLSLIAILLVNSYTSRRYEYACDQKAAEFKQNPQSVIRALVALYKKTNSLVTCSRIVELFESHPSLIHRVEAIAEFSGLHSEKVSELLSHIEPAFGAMPPASLVAPALKPRMPV